MNIFMRRILLVFMIPLATLLNGCPKSMSINLYNNSHDDLVVHFTDGDDQWPRQTVLQLTDKELNRVKWIERPDSNEKMPVLDTSNGSLHQRHKLIAAYLLPPEYMTTQRTTNIYLQMEADGLLYAIKPDGNFPAFIPIPQPSGFPIISVTVMKED